MIVTLHHGETLSGEKLALLIQVLAHVKAGIEIAVYDEAVSLKIKEVEQ